MLFDQAKGGSCQHACPAFGCKYTEYSSCGFLSWSFYLIWWLLGFFPLLFDQNPQNLHYLYWLFISLWACITVTFHHRVRDASTCIKPKKCWVGTHEQKQCWWEMTAMKCWCTRHCYYKLWQVHCALQTVICWPKGHADKELNCSFQSK